MSTAGRAADGFLPHLWEIARKSPDRLFSRFEDGAITFGELDRESDALAAGLRVAGIRSGDRVALMLRNGRRALAAIYGLAKAGAVWVPVNVQQRGDGLRYVLEHSDPSMLVADAAFLTTLRDCGADLGRLRIVVEGDAAASARFADLFIGGGFAEPPPGGASSFAIMYTSGTTGPPKGVIVTHAMMWFAAEASARVASVEPGDVMFVWEPLYHIAGAEVTLLPLLRDVSIAIVERFSAQRFWSQVRTFGATHIHYVGGILQILLKQPESCEDRSHPVRIAWGGGCPKAVWSLFQDRFGVRIRECYGMTEASSITTFDEIGVAGSIGRPLPWFSVTVADEAGNAVPAGARGEIVVEGERGAIFPGYFRNPEASARALRNGVLHTGDLGSFDADGNLFLHGRITDSVRRRGENVSAWEIEHVVARHPAVEDSAVIGVAAEIGEQDIKLFVKPRAGATVDFVELAAWLAERLAPYQNPRYFALVEDFERTPSQRIMKHRLSNRTDDCWDRLQMTGAG